MFALITRFALVAMLSSSFSGCGTQIGNPGSGGGKAPVPWFKDPLALLALNSQVFVQTVDAISAGDYAYANASSRVLTGKHCLDGNWRGDTQTAHSVSDNLGGWTSKTDLSLDRRYTDTWQRNEAPLHCNPDLSLVSVSSLELLNNEFTLESRLEDKSARSMHMQNEASGTDLRATISTEITGVRRLQFRAAPADGGLVIHEELTSGLQSKIAVPGAVSGPLSLRDDSSLPLLVDLEKTADGVIQSRTIPDGNVRVFVGQNQGHVELSFQNVTWRNGEGCVPSTGTYTFRAFAANGTLQAAYQIDFPVQGSLNMQSTVEKDKSELTLMPFACVLKEG